MEESRLHQQIHAYKQWKSKLGQTVGQYRAWLKKFGLDSEQTEKRIDECIEGLRGDRITVAFVAEFSRGKTELINAIFFAEYGQRLLPSSAGRTTMCPTELFYDNKTDQAYVRLLPIETRLQDASLMQLKEDNEQWVNYPLDLSSAARVEETLQEVVQTRRVTLEEAVRLGMYNPNEHLEPLQRTTHVDIPRWRHALISFPHPLLKQGLTILDTPGLNALGSEPELTLNMLPTAQSVLFVLAADTGVTRTDLEIWQHHIKGFHSSRRRGLMVVLNKIDTLWDELLDDSRISATIRQQTDSTAKILGIDQDSVFPISAQKGLLAKVRNDKALLEKSELKTLEDYLAVNILDKRQQIVQENITSEVSNMLENSYGLIATKLHRTRKQLQELQQLRGKSQSMIEHMLEKARQEHADYMRNVNSFKASRKVLLEQSEVLRHALNMGRLENKIRKSYKNMSGNWTTMGLKSNMQVLFDDMSKDMQVVVEQSEQARKLIRSIYRRFQNDYGFAVSQPGMLSIMRYRVDLDLLKQEADIFRKSTLTTMTEKHFVVKRFFVAMVSRARDIFFQSGQEVDNWLSSSLEPLVQQINAHKLGMEQHLNDLKNISSSRNTLKERITELGTQEQAVLRQLTLLRNMHIALNDQQSLSEEKQQGPRLVGGLDAS